MWVFPLVAAFVAFAFAARLGRRYASRRSGYLLAWSISLTMYGLASLIVALGAMNGWGEVGFLVYWALGAVLNVPFLAGGELMLLIRGRSAEVVIWLALGLTTVVTLIVLRAADLDLGELSHGLPSGKHVFGAGTDAHRLPQLISIPSYLILVGGALWSAVRMRGHAEMRDRFVGTLWIVLGATVIAGVGSWAAATGRLLWFSVALLAGVSVMFAGFLRASRPPARAMDPAASRG